jgi:hypothetical protein
MNNTDNRGDLKIRVRATVFLGEPRSADILRLKSGRTSENAKKHSCILNNQKYD